MNIPIIDLHSHSNISDGLLTPADLMSHAAENNVKAIALTDHDDIAGLKEASLAAEKLNIIFINQYGRIYYGKEAIYKRHLAVLNRSEGHIGTMPAASYTIDKLQGVGSNMAVVAIKWEHPPYKNMVKSFDPLKPMKGVFGFTFFKNNILFGGF